MLPPRREQECWLQEAVAGQGKPGQNCPRTGCPIPGLSAPPQPFPMGACAPLWGDCPVPAAVAGWAGGIFPLFICTCGWEGGGPAPNYIKNISMLWLSLLQCPLCLPLPSGEEPSGGGSIKAGMPQSQLWEGWQKTLCPACPAWSINSPASHERGWAPPLPNTSAAQDVCTPSPFLRAAEGLVCSRSSPALALVSQPGL